MENLPVPFLGLLQIFHFFFPGLHYLHVADIEHNRFYMADSLTSLRVDERQTYKTDYVSIDAVFSRRTEPKNVLAS